MASIFLACFVGTAITHEQTFSNLLRVWQFYRCFICPAPDNVQVEVLTIPD